jgi:hypothetical protein
MAELAETLRTQKVAEMVHSLRTEE